MDLTEFAKEVHENAVAHGWWESEVGFPEIIAMCHSELSEALEEFRGNRPILYYPCNYGGRRVCVDDKAGENVTCGSRVYDPENPESPCKARSNRPEGVAVELADCILRILDFCGKKNIDIEDVIKRKHEYNKTRPYRHGGKPC